MAAQAAEIDRAKTVPFHLKLFYRAGSHLRPEDFPTAASQPLPPHLQIYTWASCTLRELSHLLVSALPSLLPSPSIGTRLVFRLVYPDPSSLRNPSAPGRYTSKEFGSVVIGGDGTGRLPGEDELKVVGSDGPMSGRLEGEPEKSLQDARFVIGDYVACAVLPPGREGEVQSASAAGPTGGRMRAFPEDRGSNGFRGRRGGGYRDGGGPGRLGSSELPAGEWRRGERLPESGGRYGRRGRY